ncbi:MAG TPA: peptidoglycan-binding domain-containing protein [Candidatus Paceibacterota bacterium]|nr:peptidoglycan-binding domain-containing protein [Candidatus Paceibacterota bacterium]
MPLALAANVTVSDGNAMLVLPSDTSTYSLASSNTFDDLVVNSTNFVFTIPTGSSVVITSLDSSRDLSNTLSLSTVCNTNTSVLTIDNTSGSSEIVTITPGNACVSSNTTTTTTPVPVTHFYGQSSSRNSALVNSHIPTTNTITTTVTITTATNASISSIPRDLTLNSTGNDVEMLQQFLNAHGFILAKSGAGSAGSETTFFGALTKAALIRFQKYYHIVPAAGYFGPITRALIKKL